MSDDVVKQSKSSSYSSSSYSSSSLCKKILKGIICILFGHDWVSYNEHAWICSRCMSVAPKG